MNVAQWLRHASNELNEHDSAKLDADLLMCHVLQCERTKLYAWPEKELDTEQLEQLESLLTQRLLGQPIAYLVGQREFWSLTFDVCKAVLVPRPDTELIVELALKALPDRHSDPVLDAGTGSGAIATSLAYQWALDSPKHNSASLTIVASDNSLAAIKLAKSNAEKLAPGLVSLVRSNWLAAFADNTFGMIISNPPYLARHDPHLNNKTLQHEPIDALVSGDDGLDDIRTLITDACRVGKPGCFLLLEHGSTQAEKVCGLMLDANYTNVQTYQDIAGLDRVSCGYCP